jgi:hypothetical protein
MTTAEQVRKDVTQSFSDEVDLLNRRLTPAYRQRIYTALAAKVDRRRGPGTDLQLAAFLPGVLALCLDYQVAFKDWKLAVECRHPDGQRARLLLSVGATWFNRINVDEFLIASAVSPVSILDNQPFENREDNRPTSE